MRLAFARNSRVNAVIRLGTILAALLCFCASAGRAAQTYSVRGLVLKVDKPHLRFVASCQSIPGYMEAMVMPYPVRNAKELEGLAPGNDD